MSRITNLFLVIVNKNGETILSETHDIFFGPKGLLRVLVRLGIRLEDLVCFPTIEKAHDESNMGAPFSALCNMFNTNSGSCVTSTLSRACYLCCSEGILQVYARIECLKVLVENPSRGFGSHQFESTSTISPQQLTSDLKSSLKVLCNKLCEMRKD
jgi:hypothetical protein